MKIRNLGNIFKFFAFILMVGGMFYFFSGESQAATFYCPSDGGTNIELESGKKGDVVNDGTYTYVTRFYAIKTIGTKPMEGDFADCNNSVTPPTYGGNKPIGAELGDTKTGTGACGVAPRTPDLRPPVYKHSLCREAAVIDDAGEVVINGQKIFCVNMPGGIPTAGIASDYGAASDSATCAGRKVNTRIYTPSALNKNGWVEGAGNLFREGNCPGGGTYNDGLNDGDPNTPPLSKIIWCNASTFSWYKGHGFYGNTDYTSLIGTNADTTLKPFGLRLRYFSSVSSGAVSINITYKYRNSPLNNASSCRPYAAFGSTPGASASENIALADTSGNIIANNQVTPGQTVFLGVRFRNTGTTTWNGNFGVYGLTNSGSNDISIANSVTWTTDNTANPKRVYFQSGGPQMIAPGQEVPFWFKVTLPTTFPGGQYTLSWGMSQIVAYEGREPDEFGPSCSITVRTPQNQPYIRATGSDVLSGAVFGSNECSDIDLNSPERASAAAAEISTSGNFSYGPGTDGISKALNGLSSAQYAVFASGLISNNNVGGVTDSDANFAGNNGYTRDYYGQEHYIKDLTFATDTKTSLGVGGDDGLYGDFYSNDVAVAKSNVPCVNTSKIDKAYVDTPQAPSALGTLANDASYTNTYAHYSGDLTIGSLVVPTGRRMIVLVDGAVNITGNITAATSYGNTSDIPYLMIVSRGPIVISSGASTIDSSLFAEYNGGAKPNAGTIDTCGAVGYTPAWPTAMNVSSCRRPLKINGSILGKKIFWKGTYGTIGQPNTVLAGEKTTGCVVNDGSWAIGNPYYQSLANRLGVCAAENIGFNPELYLSNPMQSQPTTTVGNVPQSTQELPPIY